MTDTPATPAAAPATKKFAVSLDFQDKANVNHKLAMVVDATSEEDAVAQIEAHQAIERINYLSVKLA